MTSRWSYPLLALLLAACAPRAERPMFFPAPGTDDRALDCAEEILDGDGFTVRREDPIGRLTADQGRNWVYVIVIPREGLVSTIQVSATRGAIGSAREVVTRCQI